ncbi:MAG: hypothetical protein AMXMBFR84_49570 [Candidatus Hydrogenedentota bacterium]
MSTAKIITAVVGVLVTIALSAVGLLGTFYVNATAGQIEKIDVRVDAVQGEVNGIGRTLERIQTDQTYMKQTLQRIENKMDGNT